MNVDGGLVLGAKQMAERKFKVLATINMVKKLGLFERFSKSDGAFIIESKVRFWDGKCANVILDSV